MAPAYFDFERFVRVQPLRRLYFPDYSSRRTIIISYPVSHQNIAAPSRQPYTPHIPIRDPAKRDQPRHENVELPSACQ